MHFRNVIQSYTCASSAQERFMQPIRRDLAQIIQSILLHGARVVQVTYLQCVLWCSEVWCSNDVLCYVV